MKTSSSEGAVKGGWTEAQRTMDATSGFAQALKLESQTQAIKFLDDSPYVNFRRHWVKRTTKEGETNRSYTCLQTYDQDCPVCEAGDRAQAVSAFNVAIIDPENGDVLLRSWDVGPRLFGVLKGYANDPKIGPLSKGYFLVSKTGKKGTVQHNVSPVRGRTLTEDYDIPEPEADDLARLSRYDATVVERPTVKEMKEIALELGDYDD